MTDHVPIDNFGVHPFMEPPARQINNQHTMMALFLGFECWFGENRHQQLDVSTFWYFCNALDLDMKRNQKDAMGSIWTMEVSYCNDWRQRTDVAHWLIIIHLWHSRDVQQGLKMFKELFQQDQSPELSQNLKFTTDSDSFTCGQRCLVGCHGNRPKESGESRSKPQLNHRFPGSSFFSLYYEIKTSSSRFLVMLMFSSRQFIFPCLTPPSPSCRRT